MHSLEKVSTLEVVPKVDYQLVIRIIKSSWKEVKAKKGFNWKVVNAKKGFKWLRSYKFNQLLWKAISKEEKINVQIENDNKICIGIRWNINS